MESKIIGVVAYSSNRVIGNKGKIPWNNVEDRNRFKKIISAPKSIILVGYKTYITLPTILTETLHIMIIYYDDIENKDKLLLYLKRIYVNIYVIGGQWLYELLMDDLDEILATEIHGEVDGDRFFPKLKSHQWKIKSMEEKYNHDSYPFSYIKYVRIDEEYQYINIVNEVIRGGNDSGNTLSKFGTQLNFDLSNNSFPLLTTKHMFLRAIVEELLWFLRGETDVQILRDKKIHIWDKNVPGNDTDAGPIYGFNFRHYGDKYKGHKNQKYEGIDQFKNTIDAIIKEADLIRKNIIVKSNRRIIISLWNPSQLHQVCLPACHMTYQFYLHKDINKNILLSCSMYMRSADLGLGLPFNIASASLLTIIIAHITNVVPHNLIISIGDYHVYKEHIDKLKKQIIKKPYKFPKIKINDKIKKYDISIIDDLKFEDFILEDYQCHESVKMNLIV